MYGMLPRQVFETEIGKRGESPVFQEMNQEGKFPGNVIAIKKGIVICDNGIAYEFMSSNSWKIDFRGKLFGISRTFGIAVFGSGQEICITIADLKNGTTRSLAHQTSLITCAAVIGGQYLITGASDCAIRVYQLPELTLWSTSAFQGSRIIAIGGNLDVGLVVSIDSDFFMVLETLFDPRSINWIKLESDVKYRPKIEVFKSGLIAVGLRRQIRFFDARGLPEAEISVTTDLQQIEKYYDIDEHELLLVADTKQIMIVDLTNFEIIRQFETVTVFPKICGLKRQRAVLVSGKDSDYKVRSFTISTLIRPAQIPQDFSPSDE
jgi:hypothetical protein